MLKVAVIVAFSLVGTGCSTMAHGRYQNVPVTSAPAGAHVDVDCGDVPRDGGTTPATVKLRRGADRCLLTLTKDGFAPESVTMQKRVAGTTWLNAAPSLMVGLGVGAALAAGSILSNDNSANNGAMAGLAVGAAVPLLVDGSTGAMYKQTPEQVSVTLHAKP